MSKGSQGDGQWRQPDWKVEEIGTRNGDTFIAICKLFYAGLILWAGLYEILYAVGMAR